MGSGMRRFSFLAALLALAGCTSDVPPSDAQPDGVIVDLEQPIVLADGVVVPSDDDHLVDVMIEGDRLRFVYAGAPRLPFEVGSLIVGNEGAGYMGRVLEVTAEGNDRLVRLEAVGLDDVIESGAFRVQLEPSADEIRDEGEVGARSSALGGRFDLVPTEVLDGSGWCEGVGGAELRLSHTLETTGIDTDLVFEKEGLLGIRKAGVTASGGASLTVVLETEGELDARCAIDVLEALNARGIAIGARVWEKRFRVGPLPLSLSFRITPTFTADAAVVVEPTRVTTTLTARADLTLGATYESGRGVYATTELDRDVNLDVELTEGGHAHAEANALAGLHLQLDVNMLQLPRAGAEIEAHASFTTDDLVCNYAWDASVAGRAWLRGELSVDLGFFSRSFPNLDEERSFSAERRGDANVDLPWCDDGTEPDPVDPSDPTADERCGLLVGCELCNAAPGCGFCPATGLCMSDRRASECGETWQDSRASCVDCSANTDCDACNRNGFCGWCASSGTCHNATDGRPTMCEAIDWSTNVASCGA